MNIKNLFQSIKNFFTLNLDQYNYIPSTASVDLNIGEKAGIYASSHGNIIALERITNIMLRKNVKHIIHLGDIMDEHAGYIECLDYIFKNPVIKSIVGNHDLLIVKQDEIHNYEKEYIELAENAYQKLINHPDLYSKLFKLPSKIDCTYFSAVHESVQYPYYAKITKLKKKSSEIGKTPDENLEAIFNSSLEHPYFTGSDHQAYVINSSKLRKDFIKPGDKINVKGSKIISVPSISLSKDPNYTHGYCILTVEEDESLTIEFFDLPDILFSSDDIL
ncbi:metallophosphoesterase [Candidatus Dependentiae bacterium]|nr:metallophosphoesterase [Candidatus Dependentiae bacterium]